MKVIISLSAKRKSQEEISKEIDELRQKFLKSLPKNVDKKLALEWFNGGVPKSFGTGTIAYVTRMLTAEHFKQDLKSGWKP